MSFCERIVVHTDTKPYNNLLIAPACTFTLCIALSNSYTMGCPPVRGDNPRALASGLFYVQADNPWYNYFIPPTSV